MKISWNPWGILTLACVALLLFFVVYPLGVVFANSVSDGAGGFSLSGFVSVLTDDEYLQAFRNTLVLGLTVTACTVLVGVPFAYMVARYDFPLKGLVSVLPVLTIVIPEIIVGQSWLLVLGNNGLLTNFLRDFGIELPSFYGWTGMIFSMTLVYYTYIYLGVLAALRGFDGQLEEAAMSLGSSPLRSRLTVLLPVVMPAVLVNALVVFTLVVGNFALSMMLGSRVPLLSVMTYNVFINEMGGNPTLQSVMSVISIALVAAVLFVQKRVVERRLYTMTQGRAPAPEAVRSGAAMLYTGAVGLVVLVSLLPLIAVFVAAFTETSGPVMRWGAVVTDELAARFAIRA
jgi:iron(III) transport system permease protein